MKLYYLKEKGKKKPFIEYPNIGVGSIVNGNTKCVIMFPTKKDARKYKKEVLADLDDWGEDRPEDQPFKIDFSIECIKVS